MQSFIVPGLCIHSTVQYSAVQYNIPYLTACIWLRIHIYYSQVSRNCKFYVIKWISDSVGTSERR